MAVRGGEGNAETVNKVVEFLSRFNIKNQHVQVSIKQEGKAYLVTGKLPKSCKILMPGSVLMRLETMAAKEVMTVY